MPGFRAFTQTRFFHLNEVTNVCTFQQLSTRTQTGKRANSTGRCQIRVFHNGIRTDFAIIANHAVFNHATGADFHAMTESHVALDDNVSINFNIAPVSKRTAQIKTRRIAQHNAC